MINSDFHVHSTYCDGKLTLEETAQTAIEKGMKAVGFSGHSHTPFDESYCMSTEGTKKYMENVCSLKKQMDGRLEIYLGLEYDRFSDADNLDEFDYIIGSVHYVLKDGEYLPVDETEEMFMDNINKFYGGDIYAYCEDYFKEVASFALNPFVDIIGHIDLVTKFNEGGKLFDTKNERYTAAYNDALEKLAVSEKILEINTGAISRGYRKAPYPEADILVRWHELGGKIIFSGDAHSGEGLCFSFDKARNLAIKCGYEKVMTFKDGKFIEIFV